MLLKQEKRYRRHRRVRAGMMGDLSKPRLCVFRSLKHIYAQLVNDEKSEVLASASDMEIKTKSSKGKKENEKSREGKIAKAFEVGKLIAKKAEEKKIKKIAFDRGGYKYHGRVKALAEGAREAGLQF